MQLSPLVEYLLAYHDEGGHPICKLTTLIITVPTFPPGANVVWNTAPVPNIYGQVNFYMRISPSITPDAFILDINAAGFQLIGGIMGTLAISEGWNIWVEALVGDTITNTVTNITPLNQYLQVVNFFLIIPTQENYKKMLDIIRRWIRSD